MAAASGMIPRRSGGEPLPNDFHDSPVCASQASDPGIRLAVQGCAAALLQPVHRAQADLLAAPLSGAPSSLSDQLALIRKLWRRLLGDSLDRRLMAGGEVLREEELAIWMMFNPDAARARTAAEEAARRRREQGTQQWPSVVSESQAG